VHESTPEEIGTEVWNIEQGMGREIEWKL